MRKIPLVTKGKPDSLMETARANETISAINRLLGMRIVVDPLLSANSSRLEDNGTTITLVIGTRT